MDAEGWELSTVWRELAPTAAAPTPFERTRMAILAIDDFIQCSRWRP
jgi:hypothetical protein